jgi:hypothetical protein
MRFTFNEICILNLEFKSPDKQEFLYNLIELEKNTEDPVLKDDLNSLFKKIEVLSDSQINQLYTDRMNYKLTTYPVYNLN